MRQEGGREGDRDACGRSQEAVARRPGLRRELIEPLAQEGYLMVTWANEHYLDFAITWVANLKRAGIKGYIVGAMDDDMLK